MYRIMQDIMQCVSYVEYVTAYEICVSAMYKHNIMNKSVSSGKLNNSMHESVTYWNSINKSSSETDAESSTKIRL